jgi:CRISPR-associated protein (TIGR03984 family)
MNRTLQANGRAAVRTIPVVDLPDEGALRRWLTEQAKPLKAETKQAKPVLLLAHTDDGVIWGIVSDNKLALSSDVFPTVSPKLRPATLQQARLFGEHAELLIWREGAGKLQARWAEETAKDAVEPAPRLYMEYFDESMLLWGTQAEHCNGFTLWTEGAQGLRHALPWPQTSQPPCLVVRHYLAPGEASARVALSRLVRLENTR